MSTYRTPVVTKSRRLVSLWDTSKKVIEKNEGWGHIWPRVAVWGLNLLRPNASEIPLFKRRVRLVRAPIEKKTLTCFKYRPNIGALYVRKCLETTVIGENRWSNICHYSTVLDAFSYATTHPPPSLPEFSHEIKQIVLVSKHYAARRITIVDTYARIFPFRN